MFFLILKHVTNLIKIRLVVLRNLDHKNEQNNKQMNQPTNPQSSSKNHHRMISLAEEINVQALLPDNVNEIDTEGHLRSAFSGFEMLENHGLQPSHMV